ncbi:SMI1/KNR4 family protein [Aquabacterium sp. A7-Y]|uniref:SMI1/KNR4 family protein n=1 Tax=Aquabacterium sp. A7-Y TaxID=1349605 RepID=UPI00223CAADE|nr:SMI1/KNR4 family protein [Aquabacterium sp. A7-Y]MCW7541616.1 SMI1/KNR4 family protein [Aquabacterium sp. A7-Y]
MKNDIWDRLDPWLARHAQELWAVMNPPATMAQIEAAEHRLGHALPADVRAAYLRHGGTADSTREDGPYFFHYAAWCSLEAMVEDWESHCKLIRTCREDPGYAELFPEEDESWRDLEVRPEWGSPNRIPLGRTNTANTLFIDLQPGPAGVRGQLLTDGGMGEAKVVASSLGQYLETLWARIEQDQIWWHPDKGWVIAATGAHLLGWNPLYGM